MASGLPSVDHLCGHCLRQLCRADWFTSYSSTHVAALVGCDESMALWSLKSVDAQREQGMASIDNFLLAFRRVTGPALDPAMAGERRSVCVFLSRYVAPTKYVHLPYALGFEVTTWKWSEKWLSWLTTYERWYAHRECFASTATTLNNSLQHWWRGEKSNLIWTDAQVFSPDDAESIIIIFGRMVHHVSKYKTLSIWYGRKTRLDSTCSPVLWYILK